MKLKQEEEIAKNIIQKHDDLNMQNLAKRSQMDAIENEPNEQLNFNKNGNSSNGSDLSPELIFANELAKETAKSSNKEMFDFDFVFNQSDNYKQNYYLRKFGTNKFDYENLIVDVKKSYIAGIVWNFYYYYKFCVSWSWFYPYYYAPLISDLCNFSTLVFDFVPSVPFRPFEQLMAVLPPYSAHALPNCFRPLMEEENSIIIDFYPDDFHVDLAGKRFAWLGEVILPFIDDDRLKKAFSFVEEKLTEEEKIRNSLGKSYLFYTSEKTLLVGKLEKIKLEEAFSLKHWLSDLTSDTSSVVASHYEPPNYVDHQSKLLNGLRLQKSDFYYTVI